MSCDSVTLTAFRYCLEQLMTTRKLVGEILLGRMPSLKDEELDYQTQILTDRLLFMRVAEDRGLRLLDDLTLKSIVLADQPAARFNTFTTKIHQRYNGNLFEKTEFDHIHLSDSEVKAIIACFVPPKLDYRLDAFPDDFLGAVYEYCIGVQLAHESSGNVTFKPCPKRARSNGAHYTPRRIVDYIVRHTVGQWLWQGDIPSRADRRDETKMNQRKFQKETVKRLRILDPACGSGAFLLAAFEQLLDWYLERARWCPEHLTAAQRDNDYVYHEGHVVGARPRLKARIVKRHLFGVDVDSRAVEVARMSLYLRIMERTGQLFPELSLSEIDLTDNIRCGNSLVEPEDVGIDLSVADFKQINPWSPTGSAGFPEIMENGGFEVVVGNPPYVFGEYINPYEKECYTTKYQLGATGQHDLYKLFYERSLNTFLSQGGLHGFIVPDALLARDEHDDIREFVAKTATLQRICHSGQVFVKMGISDTGKPETPRSVGVSSVIVISEKAQPSRNESTVVIEQWDHDDQQVAQPQREVPESKLAGTKGDRWKYLLSNEWLKKVQAHLESTGTVVKDVLRKGRNGALGCTRGEEWGKKHLRSCAESPQNAEGFARIYAGEDICRHHHHEPGKLIAEERVTKFERYYEKPKVLFVKTGAGPVAAVVKDDLPALQSVYMLHLDDAYKTKIDEFALVAVLCSGVLTAYSYLNWTGYKKLQPQFTLGNVRELPFPNPEKVSKKDFRALSNLADKLNGDLQHLNNAAPGPKQALTSRIRKTERSIETVVCKMFEIEFSDVESLIQQAVRDLPASQKPRWCQCEK